MCRCIWLVVSRRVASGRSHPCRGNSDKVSPLIPDTTTAADFALARDEPPVAEPQLFLRLASSRPWTPGAEDSLKKSYVTSFSVGSFLFYTCGARLSLAPHYTPCLS